MSTSVVVTMLMMIVLGPDTGADVTVAPTGNDANAGTQQAPFATITRAQRAVREAIAKGLSKDLTVCIRGGTYHLTEPLVFGPADSGTADHKITYAAQPGETVVISGGRGIKGFQAGDDGAWIVPLPDVRSGRWSFRQLFVGDVRLPRARFPNGQGLLRVKGVSEDVKTITLEQAPPVKDLAGLNAELVMIQNWSISRVAILSSDGATIRVKNPMGWIGHGPATTASPHKPCYIEHAPQFLDAPGEWYLDAKTGRLTLRPLQGEKLGAKIYVAPKIEHLLIVRGQKGKPVRNLHFRGLTFAHTAWPLPEFGYLGIQAGHHGTTMKEATYVLPVAIEFTRAETCSLRRCRIEHTGACGIGFGAACRENEVVGCALSDIGGNGIVVGWRGHGDSHRIDMAGDSSLDADWKDPNDAPYRNVIANCVIERCGQVHFGSVGVYDAFCNGTRITRNLVATMPYTGISVGFRWNTSKTSQRNALVANNHIHDCMIRLADGGGIYTLGFQPGSVLRGNLIHDIHRSAYAHGGAPNNGIFFDQGSKAIHVEGQIIYHTSGKPIRFNQTNRDNLTWKDNHFGVAPGDPAFPAEAPKRTGPADAFRDLIPAHLR